MKENISSYLTLLLFFIILAIPIFLFFLVFIFEDFFAGIPSYYKPIYMAVCILVLAPLFFWLVPKIKIFTKLLDNAVLSYAVESSPDSEIYNVDKNIYRNTIKKYTRLKVYKGVILLSIIMCILISNLFYEMITFLGFAALIFCILSVIYNYFLKTIIISPEGIQSIQIIKKEFIPWDKVKQIGVCSPSGKNNSKSYTYIYISKKTLPLSYYDIKDNKGIISIQYKNVVIHHLLCHWDNGIVNLDNTKRWRKYISKIK